jgi:hypothetical protein
MLSSQRTSGKVAVLDLIDLSFLILQVLFDRTNLFLQSFLDGIIG